jgi:hypothetical protein
MPVSFDASASNSPGIAVLDEAIFQEFGGSSRPAHSVRGAAQRASRDQAGAHQIERTEILYEPLAESMDPEQAHLTPRLKRAARWRWAAGFQVLLRRPGGTAV